MSHSGAHCSSGRDPHPTHERSTPEPSQSGHRASASRLPHGLGRQTGVRPSPRHPGHTAALTTRPPRRQAGEPKAARERRPPTGQYAPLARGRASGRDTRAPRAPGSVRPNVLGKEPGAPRACPQGSRDRVSLGSCRGTSQACCQRRNPNEARWHGSEPRHGCHTPPGCWAFTATFLSWCASVARWLPYGGRAHPVPLDRRPTGPDRASTRNRYGLRGAHPISGRQVHRHVPCS